MLWATFDEITQPYTAFESWAYDKLVGPVLASFFEDFREELDASLPQGGRLLDVGCGGGHIAKMVAEWRPDIEVVGIDLSEEQVSRANRRVGALEGRVRYEVGTAVDLPFEDDSFDALISVGSIKHWPDRDKGLSECARVVRSGGIMVVTESDRSCHYEDMNRFIDRIRAPRVFKPMLRMFYRTHVAGQSIDLLDAMQLAERVEGASLTATRTSNGGVKLTGVTCLPA